MNKEFTFDNVCDYIIELGKQVKTLEQDPNCIDEAKEVRQKYSDAMFIAMFWLLTLPSEAAAIVSQRLIDVFAV